MLRWISYDIVFQEVPEEVSLAINISNCPNQCKGCHSQYLWEDTGEVLDESTLLTMLEKYGNSITCVCFMGGDNSAKEVEQMAAFLKQRTNGILKTAWYSGKPDLPVGCSLDNFDYIKLGPYIEKLGGLDSPHTNQHFYRIKDKEMIDITHLFAKKNSLLK